MADIGDLPVSDIMGKHRKRILRSEQLKPLQYALYQIVAGGPARQGAGAVVQLIIAAIPITFFIICQSNVIETMTTSGMKD